MGAAAFESTFRAATSVSCASASPSRRTVTRMPASSIVTSPTPDSWTIRTISRIRSARPWSTPPPTRLSSRCARPRTSSRAPRPPRRTARAAAAPPRWPPALRLLADLVELDRVRLGRRGPATSSTARRRGSIGPGGVPNRPSTRPAARPRRPGSGTRRARGSAPASRGPARSARRAAASRPPPGSAPARRAPRPADPRRNARADGRRARRRVRREAVLRGAHGDPRRERRHRLVADVLVDEVGGCQRASTSTPVSRPRPSSASRALPPRRGGA